MKAGSRYGVPLLVGILLTFSVEGRSEEGALAPWSSDTQDGEVTPGSYGRAQGAVMVREADSSLGLSIAPSWETYSVSGSGGTAGLTVPTSLGLDFALSLRQRAQEVGGLGWLGDFGYSTASYVSPTGYTPSPIELKAYRLRLGAELTLSDFVGLRFAYQLSRREATRTVPTSLIPSQVAGALSMGVALDFSRRIRRVWSWDFSGWLEFPHMIRDEGVSNGSVRFAWGVELQPALRRRLGRDWSIGIAPRLHWRSRSYGGSGGTRGSDLTEDSKQIQLPVEVRWNF